jgi:hypothetical protein
MSIVPTANQQNAAIPITAATTSNAVASINNSSISNNLAQQQHSSPASGNNQSANSDTKAYQPHQQFSNLNVSALSSSTILNPLSIVNSSSPAQSSTTASAKKSTMSSSALNNSNSQQTNSIVTLTSNVSMSSSVTTAASFGVASLNEAKSATSQIVASSPAPSIPIAQTQTLIGESQAQLPTTPAQSATNNPPVYDDISIFMWSVCKTCNKSTKRQVMSPDTWSFSLAKFLEITFHSNAYRQFNEEATNANSVNYCTHSLLQDHYQYFRFKNVVTVFSLSKISINSLNLPNIVLKSNVRKKSNEN